VLTGTVTVDSIRLGYDVHGDGIDTVVLLPALLISRGMQAPVARRLALRHIRVVCLDYLGERTDGAAHDPADFSSERLGALVIAALGELGIERAVIGGTSIGANIALEAALQDPDRFTGLLLEGPFLDNAARATALVFSALFAAVTLGRPLLTLAARATRIVNPARRLGLPGTMVLQDPARAAAFLQGLMFGRVGPPSEERVGIGLPALVIGYPIDPLHPPSDAATVAEELPLARLVRTPSIADLRVRPERLAGEIARFVGDCRRRTQPLTDAEAAA
jgi:pimeloyl-ACP methyl ester carboxylesterase